MVGEVGIVESVDRDGERGGVLGQLGYGGVEGRVEEGTGHAALDDAEVVVDGPGDLLVRGDEGLGDDEGEFRVGLGEEDVASGQGWGEGDEEGGAALGEDGGGLIHARECQIMRRGPEKVDLPAGVDADSTLADNGELGQLRLVNRLLAVGAHDSQGRDAGESSTGAETTTNGDGTIHQDLHALRPEARAALAAQELESAAETAPEVVGPLMDLGVDGHITVDVDFEGAGGELVALEVCDLEFEGGRVRGSFVDGDGEDGVGGDGHRQDGVEGVVDVLADDVHATRRAGDEGGGVAVLHLELVKQRVPALCLDGEGIFGVDVGEGRRGGDGAGHGGRCLRSLLGY